MGGCGGARQRERRGVHQGKAAEYATERRRRGCTPEYGGRGARHRAAVGVRRAGGSSGPQKKYFVLPLMTDIPAFWIFDHSCIPHKPYNHVDNIFIYIDIPSQALILSFKNVIPKIHHGDNHSKLYLHILNYYSISIYHFWSSTGNIYSHPENVRGV